MEVIGQGSRPPRAPRSTRSSRATSSPSAIVTAPAWDERRPYLTGAFLSMPSEQPPEPLSVYPVSQQHTHAVADALDALLAVRVCHLSISSTSSQSAVYQTAPLLDDPSADPEIRALLARILPLASHHAFVKAFVERARLSHVAGHVRQAAGVAIHSLLDDYRQLILRLEQRLHGGRLPLQRLLYHVQPAARSMALLHDVVVVLDSRVGAAALDRVYNLAVTRVGSPDARSVLDLVLARAAAPVFDALHLWLVRGLVDDPYEEFFIVHNRRVPKEAGWHTRYAVNWDQVPVFLQSFVDKILRAGKYLNVLRECDVDTDHALAEAAGSVHPQPDDIRLAATDLLESDAPRRIGRVVDHVYTLSAVTLMNCLSTTVRIKERLRCLRKFFLLQQGDYLVHFFDAAADELAKPREEVSRSKLSSLLDLSIRSSASAADPFQEDLSCVLCTEDLATRIAAIASTGMGDEATGTADGGAASDTASASASTSSTPSISGYESFSLDFELQWPANLIVSTIDIMKYQFLFRYIFQCKHVERELEDCWRYHSQMHGAMRKVPQSFVRSFALRNRMMQFVRNMLYYTVADVIEPNWRDLENAMRKASTIDDIMQNHSSFLDLSVNQNLLSNEKHLRVFKNIAETCITFAMYTEKYSEVFASREPAYVIEETLKERNYPATLAKFETSFDTHLGKLLDGLSAVSKKSANIHLANLCERLDSGGYYARARERTLASFGSLAI